LSLYELAILGDATTAERTRITQTIAEMVADFGLKIGDDVLIHDAASVASRDLRAAFAAAYFGGDPTKDLTEIQPLLGQVCRSFRPWDRRAHSTPIFRKAFSHQTVYGAALTIRQ
jgi:hypothetical protein